MRLSNSSLPGTVDIYCLEAGRPATHDVRYRLAITVRIRVIIFAVAKRISTTVVETGAANENWLAPIVEVLTVWSSSASGIRR